MLGARLQSRQQRTGRHPHVGRRSSIGARSDGSHLVVEETQERIGRVNIRSRRGTSVLVTTKNLRQ